MNLDAKGATNVLADDTDLRLLETKMERRYILHHVRRLRPLVDRKPRLSGVPVGNDRARLQCYAGVPSKNEICFHHLVRGSKGVINGACVVIALEGQIVAKGRMYHRRRRI